MVFDDPWRREAASGPFSHFTDIPPASIKRFASCTTASSEKPTFPGMTSNSPLYVLTFPPSNRRIYTRWSSFLLVSPIGAGCLQTPFGAWLQYVSQSDINWWRFASILPRRQAASTLSPTTCEIASSSRLVRVGVGAWLAWRDAGSTPAATSSLQNVTVGGWGRLCYSRGARSAPVHRIR
jgi:hypothetical protein